MKILLATSIYPPEIAEPGPYVKELAKRLAPNHEVKLLAIANQVEKINGVNIITAPKKRRLGIRLFLFARTMLKESKGMDIIYAQSGVAATIPSIIVAKLRRLPLVVRNFENEAEKRIKKNHNPRYVAMLKSLQDYSLRKCNHVVSPTPNFENSLADKTSFIPNPAKPKIKFPFAVNKEECLIYLDEKISANTLSAVIGAVKELKDNFPHLKIVLTDEHGFGRLINDYNLKTIIKKLKWTTKAERSYWQAKSKITIIDADNNDASDKIALAWQNQSIIISTKQNELNSDNSLVVNSMNSVDLGLAISKLLRDQNLLNNINKNADKDLHNLRSWTYHISKLEDLFNTILNER